MREMSKKSDHKESTLQIKIGEEDFTIKANSIHQFVKKFAKSIFKSYKIPEKNGRLKYEQFRDWLQKHKNLYDDYYSGFHSEIWEFDSERNLPEYLKKEA